MSYPLSKKSTAVKEQKPKLDLKPVCASVLCVIKLHQLCPHLSVALWLQNPLFCRHPILLEGSPLHGNSPAGSSEEAHCFVPCPSEDFGFPRIPSIKHY